MTRSRSILGALAILLATVVHPPAARAFAPDPIDMAAAKREGKVAWYTSTPIEEAQKIGRLFEERTGIKVELFRSGGSAVLSRFLQEHAAGRIATDVLTMSDSAAAVAMARKGMLVPFKPVNFDNVPDFAKDPAGHFIAERLNITAIFARGDKVRKDNMPKSWGDLANPHYKGVLVMPDPAFTAIQLMVVGTLSKTLGWKYYEDLRRNEVMIVQGNQQVSDALKKGERVIAAVGTDNFAVLDRKAGFDMVTIYPAEGVFAIPTPMAIIRGGPNPNAAKAFVQFIIGDEVQTIYPAQGLYAARADMAPPPGSPHIKELKLIPIDVAEIEKDSVKIKERFAEIFQ
ncbi:MAG: extracellular solute-binding protein [Alphaproteobacteria bacterium]|nr:extracellular solute-binding protein [Alphaproteobacteria bacterium]